MVRVIRVLGAPLLFAAAPGAAVAQDVQQTPEGALRFLVINLPGSFVWGTCASCF